MTSEKGTAPRQEARATKQEKSLCEKASTIYWASRGDEEVPEPFDTWNAIEQESWLRVVRAISRELAAK